MHVQSCSCFVLLCRSRSRSRLRRRCISSLKDERAALLLFSRGISMYEDGPSVRVKKYESGHEVSPSRHAARLYLGSNSSYTQDVWKRVLFLSQVFAQECAVERSIPWYWLISRKDLKQEDNLRFLTLFQWDIIGTKLERVFRQDPVQGRENKHMSPGKEQTTSLALRQHNASKLLPDT